MEKVTPKQSNETVSTGGYRLTAMIIACGLFMENLDATVLTTALPTMAHDFGVSAPAVSIAVTSYLLALAIFVPASGAFADRYGAKAVFRSAIIVFMVGSCASALSESILTIAFARFLQGIGGAMMVPVGRLILLRSVEKSDMVKAQSWLLMPGLIGTISGPPIGGFIVTYFDWRWIFWINIPIGIVGIFLVNRFIRDTELPERRAFDFTGFVLSGIGLGIMMIGLEMVGPAALGPVGWIFFAVGVGVFCLYLRHAIRAVAPILDVTLVRFQTFRLAMIGGTLTRITHGAQSFLLSLMLQLGFGLSALQSGSITLATAVGTFLMKSMVARIITRLGFRYGLIVMGILGSGTYALCGLFRPDWPVPAMVCVLVLAGYFMSFQFTAYNTIAYDEVPKKRMSDAISFYATFQQISLSLGVCTAATVLQVSMVTSGVISPSLRDFSVAFFVVTAISFCSVFVNVRFARDAGAGFYAAH